MRAHYRLRERARVIAAMPVTRAFRPIKAAPAAVLHIGAAIDVRVWPVM